MKILVVDDHPIFLDGLFHVLRRLDPAMTPVQVTGAEQALDRLQRETDFELILVDINMPGMDGLDLLATLIERQIWIPTVIISAHENARVIQQALDAGALGFIPKSFTAAELLTALRQVLDGGMFLPDSLQAQLEQLRRVDSKRRPGSDAGRDYAITPRQLRVLELLVKGYSNRKIALTLNLSEYTVKSHLKALFAVLRVDNRTACARKAEELGLVVSAPGAGSTGG